MWSTAARFMSPEEFADYLGVPVGSVYAWRYKGAGPRAMKVGRHVRYRVEDVEAWIEAQADKPHAS